MNEKFNKNAKVEQLTKVFLSLEEEKGLIVKDLLMVHITVFRIGSLVRKQISGIISYQTLTNCMTFYCGR